MILGLIVFGYRYPFFYHPFLFPPYTIIITYVIDYVNKNINFLYLFIGRIAYFFYGFCYCCDMDQQRISQLINDMKSLAYCCRRIISLNEELEVINHQMTGLARTREELSKEQEKSNLPFPYYQHVNRSPLALMELEDKKQKEIEYYRTRIFECEITERLHIIDQNILWDMYIFKKNHYDVADKYGYSRRGLYKHIQSFLKAI